MGDWIVPAGMFVLMVGMGLTLTVDDFGRIARLPRPTLVGTALQLVAMPLAGMALAHAFGLPPMLAVGLVIVAACPGGVMSNVLCHLGRADTALSVTLTATATAVTLVTLPLWARALLASLGAGDANVAMPVVATALDLGSFTVLPVALGMAVRHVAPAATAAERWLTRAGAVTIVLAIAVEAVRRDDPPVAAFAASWPPAACLLAAALVLGLGVSRAAGLDWRATTTITLELCIKNTVLALFVATQSLDLAAAVPIAAFMAFQTPVGIGLLVVYNLRWRRGVVPGPARAAELD